MEFPNLGANCGEQSCNMLVRRQGRFLTLRKGTKIKEKIVSVVKEDRSPPKENKKWKCSEEQILQHFDLGQKAKYLHLSHLDGPYEDFLPMKCDACSQVFCRDHIHYATHNCPDSYKKDNQVPMCPLCNTSFPLKKGESPDIVIGSHIDNDCQSDPARQRRKIYTNKCSVKGCKQKELIPVNCDRCQKNYCLKHRHEQDHACLSSQEAGQSMSKAGAAAVSRMQNSTGPFIVNSSQKKKQPEKKNNRSNQNTRMAASSIQGQMSEDEALAKALQLSLEDNPEAATPASKKMTRQEEEDFQLAQAIAASQAENSRSTNTQASGSSQSRDQKTCSVS